MLHALLTCQPIYPTLDMRTETVSEAEKMICKDKIDSRVTLAPWTAISEPH